MGEIEAAKYRLRAWGSRKALDVKGMFKATIQTVSGARKRTWVYVVDGIRPEPLLGEEDAEYLGVITLHLEGRTEASINRVEQKQETQRSVASKLRKAGITLRTKKPTVTNISEAQRHKTLRIVKRYTGSVFTERVGKLEGEEVRLRYERDFKPVQPPRYPVPYHYQERLSAHLRNMRRDGVIEDVDPTEKMDCVLNVQSRRRKRRERSG